MDLPDAAAATAISTTPVGVATVADLPAPSPPTRTSARTVRRGGSHDGVSTRHGPSVDASTTTTTTTTLKASCLSVTDAKVRTDRSRSSSRLVPKKGAKPAPKKNRRSNNSSTAAGSRDASSSSSTPENLRRSTTTKPSSKVEMIEDVHPNRLANPLIPDHNLGKLQDLLTVTNGIEFHLPDTYSVHYLANVLGLSHLLLPPDNANGKVSVDSLLDRLQRPSSSLLPTTTTAAAVASIGTTTTADSDSVFGIPARRGYWDYVVNGGGGGGNDDDDDDEVRQLRRTSTNDWDPLYTQLWETPWDRVVCVPVTALQHSKLWPSTTAAAVAVAVDAATAPTDPTTTTKTTEDDGVAVTTANTNNTNTTAATGVVSSNPTTAAAKKLPRRQQQQRMVAVVKDAVQKAAAPTVTEAWQTNRVQCWPWERACERYSDGGTGWEPWLRSVLGTTHSTATNTTAQTMGGGGGGGTIHIHPVEGWVAVRECMDRTTTISKNTCGGVAAVAAGILYQFEWYRNIHQSVESSELIVRVLDVSTTLATAATPPSDGDQSVTNEVLSLKEQEETQVWLRLMLMALVLEQARVCDVWYALVPTSSEVDRAFYQTYFGMIPTAYDASVMVCDLHRCSSRCTFLRFHEEKKRASDLTAAMAASTALPRQVSAASKIPNSNDNNSKQRWLVCLPTAEDAKAAVFPPELGSEAVEESSAPPTMQDVMLAPPPVRLKRPPTRKASNNSIGSSSGADAAHAAAMYFSSADKAKRSLTVALRAVVPDGDCMKLFRLNAADETVGDELMIPLYHQNPPSLDIMRNFSLITPPPQQNKEEKSSQVRESATGSQAEDPISQELIAKQKALTLLEKRLEPTFYSLLASVVTERVNYESAETAAKYDEEKRILEESRTLLDRRKELDMAWQKQLEQDMDAVCDICADGEVTPDNQILFCEFCNVAVHQMCYGVERVPEGDYYCMACRRLGRDKQRLGATQLAPQALPIYCELCPLRQGAYIRTDIKRNDGDTSDRWVHVVCAKWQGCAYVDNNNQELIEDVTDLKQGFRRHGIRCELCLGERGAMNKCMGADGCKKWFHVTCARAAGKSQVTHGENCRGPVEENPWSLACPEHSILTDEDIQENAVPVDILILAARKFPPEPKPPPPPKPFNTLTGSERKELLADPNYERALISELLLKKFFGVRCEVCDVIDEDSKNLTRCVGCNVVFCSSCKLDLDDTKSGYKCPSCTFVERKEKAGEAFETPQCCTCYQVGGFLREGIANPVNRKSYWKTNLKEFEKSVFGKQLWVHALCAL